jgi:1,4-dihydroxy-2-naphthoyl-CoA hydrolase
MNPITPDGPPELTLEYFRRFGAGHLPGLVGVEILSIGEKGVESRLPVRREVMAPNGFLHAATVIALADTSCGYGCVALLPQGAKGFTTIELKANFLGTARDGMILCRATPVHLGRNTQVWDAEVTAADGGRKIALFRCTQMILWQNPKP